MFSQLLCFFYISFFFIVIFLVSFPRLCKYIFSLFDEMNCAFRDYHWNPSIEPPVTIAGGVYVSNVGSSCVIDSSGMFVDGFLFVFTKQSRPSIAKDCINLFFGGASTCFIFCSFLYVLFPIKQNYTRLWIRRY